jgi:hypothetical protein
VAEGLPVTRRELTAGLIGGEGTWLPNKPKNNFELSVDKCGKKYIMTTYIIDIRNKSAKKIRNI